MKVSTTKGLCLFLAVLLFFPAVGRSAEIDNLKKQMKSLNQEITAALGQGQCKDSKDCKSIEFGAKPCGGPWKYLIYSSKDAKVDQLRLKVSEYIETEKKVNELEGMSSTCDMEERPMVECIKQKCVETKKPRSLAPQIPQ